VNVRYERAIFCERKQHASESVEQFLRDLYSLVATCRYTDEEEQILDRFVQGLQDAHVKRKLHLQDNLTLEKALDITQL
jgi:hypothetical protein